MPLPVHLRRICVATLFTHATAVQSTYSPSAHLDYLTQEVNFIAPLKDRLTGSPKHHELVSHIQSQLEDLGLAVQCDDLEFTYFNGPLSEPAVSLGGDNMPVTSYSTYSGFTGPDGVSGKLVDVKDFLIHRDA